MKVRSAWPILAGLALVLTATNIIIVMQQRIVDRGQTVLLELRPVDPRSLIQGDYMRLRYAGQAFPDESARAGLPRSGTLVMKLGARNVATFARLDDGMPLADDEVRLRYRRGTQRGDLDIGAQSFLFEEGQSEAYDEARFGILKVDDRGASVLVGLADAEGRRIVPGD